VDDAETERNTALISGKAPEPVKFKLTRCEQNSS